MKFSLISICLMMVASMAIKTVTAADKIMFCYYGSWAIYRPGAGKFTTGDIDPKLCTHVGYSFFGANEDGSIKNLDLWADIDLGNLPALEALKKVNPSLKSILVVGGWNEGSQKYSNIAKSQEKMKRFADTAIALMEKFNFNGFDLDWEYPTVTERGGVKEDFVNYITFIKYLKERFGTKYTLSAAVYAVAPKTGLPHVYDIPQMVKYMDFINIMAYDLYGSWDKKTGIHTTLEGGSDPTINVRAAIDYWMKSGAPGNKLVLGIGTYGKSFTLASANNHGIGALATGPGNPGEFTREGGTLGYNEICDKLRKGELTEVYDEKSKVPYAFGGNQWVGYDNVRSIGEKTKLIAEKGLAGAMIWSIETDDFRGTCGTKYPLLNAINSGLNGKTTPLNPIQPPVGTTTTTTTSKPNVTPNPTVVPTKSPIVNGEFVCPSSGYFVNPNNCSQFFVCVSANTKAQPMNCPPGLNFNESIRSCDWPTNVKC